MKLSKGDLLTKLENKKLTAADLDGYTANELDALINFNEVAPQPANFSVEEKQLIKFIIACKKKDIETIANLLSVMSTEQMQRVKTLNIFDQSFNAASILKYLVKNKRNDVIVKIIQSDALKQVGAIDVAFDAYVKQYAVMLEDIQNREILKATLGTSDQKVLRNFISSMTQAKFIALLEKLVREYDINTLNIIVDAYDKPAGTSYSATFNILKYNNNKITKLIVGVTLDDIVTLEEELKNPNLSKTDIDNAIKSALINNICALYRINMLNWIYTNKPKNDIVLELLRYRKERYPDEAEFVFPSKEELFNEPIILAEQRRKSWLQTLNSIYYDKKIQSNIVSFVLVIGFAMLLSILPISFLLTVPIYVAAGPLLLIFPMVAAAIAAILILGSVVTGLFIYRSMQLDEKRVNNYYDKILKKYNDTIGFEKEITINNVTVFMPSVINDLEQRFKNIKIEPDSLLQIENNGWSAEAQQTLQQIDVISQGFTQYLMQDFKMMLDLLDNDPQALEKLKLDYVEIKDAAALGPKEFIAAVKKHVDAKIIDAIKVDKDYIPAKTNNMMLLLESHQAASKNLDDQMKSIKIMLKL